MSLDVVVRGRGRDIYEVGQTGLDNSVCVCVGGRV